MFHHLLECMYFYEVSVPYLSAVVEVLTNVSPHRINLLIKRRCANIQVQEIRAVQQSLVRALKQARHLYLMTKSEIKSKIKSKAHRKIYKHKVK